MGRRALVLVALVAILAGAVLAQQQGAARARGGWMGRDMTPEQRAEWMQRMQERRLTQVQESLGASEDEWAVLSEPIKGLLALDNEERQAGQELRELLSAEGTTTEQLKEALAKYRKAMKDIAAKREKLQAQLKELVTVRQEAVLVVQNVLD